MQTWEASRDGTSVISGKMSTNSKAEYSPPQTSAKTPKKHIEHLQVKVSMICAKILDTPGVSSVPILLDTDVMITIWRRCRGGEAYFSVEERERAEYMWRWQQSERMGLAINYIIAKFFT